MTKKSLNERAEMTIRVLAVALLSWGTLPISISLIAPNVDNSGMYLLNIASQLGLKFGTDLSFTYGPLGFLYITYNIGHNALIAIMFYGALALAQVWLVFRTFRRLQGRCGMVLICCSVALLLSGVSLWTKDYYICFLVFLALSLAWTEERPHQYLIFASVTTVILALIKFNTGVQCVITLVLFVLGKLFLEKRRAVRFLPYIPAIVVVYVVAFLSYNPSFSGLSRYILTSLEISSGYNTAMSIVPMQVNLIQAILCGGCFCVLLVIIFLADRESGVYLLIFSGALFQTFKHGYVRADAHIYIFFMGFLMIITVMALFLNYIRLLPALKRKRGMAMSAGFLTAVILAIPVYVLNPSPRSLVEIFPNKMHEVLYGVSSRMNMKILPSQEDALPKEMLEIIGEDKVAIMPWELSIGAYNDINMAVMPSLQSLMAYTADLDKENAEFFTGNSAPEYVIFAFYAIDGRIPLLETPATWQAIYENYNAVLIDDVYLLLKKTDTPYKIELGKSNTQTLSSDTQIELPNSPNGTYVRVKTELTLWGRINKLLYQVPPVTITLNCNDGSKISGRVLPEVLQNGIALSNLPNTLQSMGMEMNGQTMGKKIESFRFAGDGWKYYKDTMSIYFQDILSEKEFYEYVPFEDKEVQEIEDPTVGLYIADMPRTLWVDFVNGVALQTNIHTNRATGLYLTGWALDDPSKSVPEAIYLKVGDQYYQLQQTERPDVSQIYYGNTEQSLCGFEGWLPMDDFFPGDYPMEMIILCEGGTSFYKATISTVTID